MKEKEALFKNVYARELKKIEKNITAAFKGKKPRSLYEPSEFIMKSGGKRLRPMLVLFSAWAAGGKFSSVINAALAVELIHNFTLVHDDIMDNAAKRRNRLTLHNKYDLNTAILTGDNLIPIAYDYLLKDIKNGSLKIVSDFTKAIRVVCEGQSLDEDFEIRKEVTIREYKEMISKKTAALLEMCCSIGAQIVCDDKTIVRKLENYGRSLGMAFQLKDDLLDLTANETKFGKVPGGDLIEGKKTFLLINALETAKGKDLRELKRLVKNRGITADEVGKFRDMFIRLGVVENTKKQIKLYTNKAIKNLDGMPNPDASELLTWLALELTAREN